MIRSGPPGIHESAGLCKTAVQGPKPKSRDYK